VGCPNPSVQRPPSSAPGVLLSASSSSQNLTGSETAAANGLDVPIGAVSAWHAARAFVTPSAPTAVQRATYCLELPLARRPEALTGWLSLGAVSLSQCPPPASGAEEIPLHCTSILAILELQNYGSSKRYRFSGD